MHQEPFHQIDNFFLPSPNFQRIIEPAARAEAAITPFPFRSLPEKGHFFRAFSYIPTSFSSPAES